MSNFVPVTVRQPLPFYPISVYLYGPRPAFLLPLSLDADLSLDFQYNPSGDGETFENWPNDYAVTLVLDTAPTQTAVVATMGIGGAAVVLSSAICNTIPSHTVWRLLINIPGDPDIVQVAMNGIVARADGHLSPRRVGSMPFLFTPPRAFLLPMSRGADMTVDFRFNPSGDNVTFVDWPPGVTVSFVVNTPALTVVAADISESHADVYLPAAICDAVMGDTLWRVLATITVAGWPTVTQVALNGLVYRADGYDRPPGSVLNVAVAFQGSAPVVITPVPGTRGVPGPAGSYTDVVGEIPAPFPDGFTKTFTVTKTFIPGTVMVYRNGVREQPWQDYIESPPNQIVFVVAPFADDELEIDYLVAPS